MTPPPRRPLPLPPPPDDDLALPTDCRIELSGDDEPAASGAGTGVPLDDDLAVPVVHDPEDYYRTVPVAVPAAALPAALDIDFAPRPSDAKTSDAAFFDIAYPASGFTTDDAASGSADFTQADAIGIANVAAIPSAFTERDAAGIANDFADDDAAAAAISNEFTAADAASASNDFADDGAAGTADQSSGSLDFDDDSGELRAAHAGAADRAGSLAPISPLDPEVTADARGGAARGARHVHERLRSMTLASQIKLAAAGELHERIVLERLYGKNVWETLLRNPRLTAPEVSRIARFGSLPRVLLELILGNGAWLQIPEVRRALLSNPRLGNDQIIKVLRLTPKHELKLAAVQSGYPQAVRNAARMLLRGD